MKFLRVLPVILLLNFFVAAQKKTITVYLAGDSTMAEKLAEKRPETGWGEKLQQYFDVKKVKIENHAQNGRSTKSFIGEGRWQTIVSKLKRGDYVFIEFGHNDEKVDKPAVYAAANTDYRVNLIKFVTEARAKKAIPILLTPVARRKFDAQGNIVATHGEYPDAVRKVAGELKVSLIDMEKMSADLLRNYGAEKSKMLFLQLKAGENTNYPNGVEDNTHFNDQGAEGMARLAVAEIKRSKTKLRKFLEK